MIGSQRRTHRRTVEAVAAGTPPNEALAGNLSPLERTAVVITDRVGTMGSEARAEADYHVNQQILERLEAARG